jgi:hAT family C-terminal dimerisation region
MASSVSSERAFSSAGITISKRRNRLQGNIVESLQFLKCLIRNDLIFRAPQPSSILEEFEEMLEDDGDPQWEDEDSTMGWDNLFVTVDSDGEE